ncbi:MAG: sulfatase-like hydrolase/transferase [Planctomycetota bacterium]|nr:sulfatase-like hydrolase/transferase [Planctomycetaceae bacterium]MDQ3329574.1 sulfatase-like hydrolase/transferase [Planctomycetota bacterium]
MCCVSFALRAALTVAAVAPVASVEAAAKPNVIVFLSDDEGYGELGCQGNDEIPTPNIDSIAKNGIRFTNGYVSGPYCSPTRAGLMTGRYQTRFGHEFNPGGNNPEAGLPLSETTIANRMKELGYQTCAVGKWHLGQAPKFHPLNRGFDEFYGTLQNTPFFHPTNFVDSRISPDVQKVEDDDFYTTDAYAARAVDWLDKRKDGPYFLYVPFNAQHAPLQAPQKYLDRFPNITDEKRKIFAGMMSAKDDAVGAVLKKVRDLGQEENTLIFYLADNGGPTPVTTSKNDPLRGFKSQTLEGGVRVPFMVQWKGVIPAGKTYENPVIQLDILPTAIAAAGGTVEESWKLDGVNLMPFLTGKNDGKPHETLYWRFGPQWAIRQGDWKLVASRPDNLEPKLFNLVEDIGEAHDMSAAEPEKVKELTAAYESWNAELADPLWRAPMNNRRAGQNRSNAARPNNQRRTRKTQ